jgi:hypothetical protein
VTFLPAALFDFVCFFLVFFLAAIRAVYHRHKCGTKPRWLYSHRRPVPLLSEGA